MSNMHEGSHLQEGLLFHKDTNAREFFFLFVVFFFTFTVPLKPYPWWVTFLFFIFKKSLSPLTYYTLRQ